MQRSGVMNPNQTPTTEHETNEKAVNQPETDHGAKGKRPNAPAGDQEGRKWPGGGEKGEDE